MAETALTTDTQGGKRGTTSRGWSAGLRALLLSGVALGTLAFASGASALDDITVSPAPAAEAEGTCPALTRIKYPWSNCGEGFAIGFTEGVYGEPPESQCRLTLRNGMCAATTEPWNSNYLGMVPRPQP